MGKILLVLLVVALAVYLTVRLIERRGVARPEQRPFGPDDDPDFLRDIDPRRPDGPDDSR